MPTLMVETISQYMKVQLSFILILLTTWLSANEIEGLKFTEVKSQKQWDAVIEKAAANGQLLFIDAYTDWCAYCHKLDKEVYTDKSVISYFEKEFVNVKFDAESEFGYQLADFYGIDSYPTLLFLTPDRTVFERIEGFVPAPTLKAYGEEVLNDWATLPILEQAFNDQTLERDSYLELVGILERTDREQAELVATAYASTFTAEDYLDIENIWFLTRFENGLNSKHYAYITSHKDELVKAHGQSEFNDYMSGVYNDNLTLAIKYGDISLMKRLVSETLPLFIPEDEMISAKYVTESVYYMQREEFDSYKLTVNGYMNNHLATDEKPDFIISTAVDILENYDSEVLYSFSKTLLTEAINIDDKRFESHALFGYVNGLQSDFKQANESLDKAKQLAKTDEQKAFVENLKQAVRMMQ